MPRPLYIPGWTAQNKLFLLCRVVHKRKRLFCAVAIDEGILMSRLTVLALLLLGTQDPAPLKAGFAEIDISPAPGTRKIGWNNKNQGDKVVDPLYARAAAFECGEGRVGFIGLDLLFVHRDQVAEIRKRIQEKTGFPGESVLIGATHNHAGPAIETDLYPKDDAYIALMIEKSVAAFAQAWE